MKRSVSTVMSVLVFLVTMTMSCAVVGLPDATAGTAAGEQTATSFHVYTMERDADRPYLEQYGAARAVVVYDQFKFQCTSSGCMTATGSLPNESEFRASVRQYIDQFSGGDDTLPIALDLEGIALPNLSPAAAAQAVGLWKQLIGWTHAEAPQAPVGMYGYDWETANRSLTAELYGDGLLDFFAPRAYFDSSQSQTDWLSRLDASIAADRSISSSLPIYPFISPQRIGGTQPYVSGAQWDYMFNNSKSRTTGVFLWEPTSNDATACSWLGEFAYEMGTLTGTSSSGPLTAHASPPSGSCTIPRGATTSIPVDVHNTSSATTPATTMQSISGLPQGIAATWRYWNVPSLAPGASWKTALVVTVPAGEEYSSTLVQMRTGISNTRLTLIVTG